MTEGQSERSSVHQDSDPLEGDVDEAAVELAVEVFGMLADSTRVRIVLAIRGGELPVGRLAEMAGKNPTAVSQHLAKLRLSRMVTTRQDGTRVFYRGGRERDVAGELARP